MNGTATHILTHTPYIRVVHLSDLLRFFFLLKIILILTRKNPHSKKWSNYGIEQIIIIFTEIIWPRRALDRKKAIDVIRKSNSRSTCGNYGWKWQMCI